MGDDLIKDLEGLKQTAKKLQERSCKKWLIFTLGNTQLNGSQKIYFTPIRIGPTFVMFGAVVFSESEGEKILKNIDGFFSHIFIDCEKKSSLQTVNEFDLFNLERLSHEIVKKSFLRFFKGNDLTVDAIDNFIFHWSSSKRKMLGGSKLLIVGIGNIGTKIALRLVERGCHVYLLSRSEEKSKYIAKFINFTVPAQTIAKASAITFNEAKLLAHEFDCVLLTHTGKMKRNTEIYEQTSDKCLFLEAYTSP